MKSTILITFLFSPLLKASFLATGPPASPVLNNHGSANLFDEAELGKVLRLNHSDNSSLINSITSSLYFNQTNLEETVTMGSDPLWLTNPISSHKVYQVISFAECTVT